MQAIVFIGFISILSLDWTHGSSKCYKSRICIHTNNEKCGKNSRGQVRWFIDSCDMKEYNCLQNTYYIPTHDKECKHLSKPKSKALKPKIIYSEEPDDNDESEKESNENSKPEENRNESERQVESTRSDEDEDKKESEKHEVVNNSDDKTKEVSEDVTEFEPKVYQEVKKMSHRVKKPVKKKEVYEYVENVNESEGMSGEVVNLSSEELGLNHEDYFFDRSFFVARSRTD